MFLSAESTSSLIEKARRRSVDVGGLALALGADEGHLTSGYGWVGGDQIGEEPMFAELIGKMYDDTRNMVGCSPSSTLIRPEREERARLVKTADSWGFEPQKLPDDQLTYIAFLLFEALYRIKGVQEAVGIPIDEVGILLCRLRNAYRQLNSYHNFQHAVDVLQATHHLLREAGRVPPVSLLLDDSKTWTPCQVTGDDLVACLGPLDLFCLYIASIGHDVGHPGFTNKFMQNARAPLAELYDDKSPLENLHYTLLVSMLREQGIASILDTPNGPHSRRKLLHETVLATDMRVHADFMTNFQRLVDGHELAPWRKRVLLCQAIIKWADISNPGRPLSVSQHWASCLGEEWTSQAVLEQYLNMPASLHPAEGPLSEAQSQVFFIETFAWPLFKLIAQGIPAAAPFVDRCGENLSIWKKRVDTLSSAPSEDAAETTSVSTTTPSQLPEEFLGAFPMTLPSMLVNADHSDRFSQNEWQSVTSCGSRSSPSFSSSRSASPSPVSSTAPVPLPPLSSASTSTVSGSSESSTSPRLSPSDPPSAAPSRAISIMSASSTLAAPCVIDSGKAAIRAAYKASVRKKPSFQNRSSWSPGPRGALQTVPGVNVGLRAGVLSSAPTTRREVPITVAADGATT